MLDPDTIKSLHISASSIILINNQILQILSNIINLIFYLHTCWIMHAYLIFFKLWRNNNKHVARSGKMQRGVSAKSSSSNTAFLVTEAIAEAKDSKQSLFFQYLDVKKAFDVVWHTRLLCFLYQQE